MKRILMILLGLGIVIGGMALYTTQDIHYNAPTTVEKEIIKEVDALETRKKEAWKQGEAEAKEKAQEAYEEVLRLARVESDLSVVREVQTELDEQEIQLMASSSFPVAQVQ